jgi:hypothetical protein
VKSPIEIQARRDAWFLAAVFLIAFCFLGSFTARVEPIFQKMEFTLSTVDRFIVMRGPTVFPLLGVSVAAAFILLEFYSRRRWIQWVLVALCSFIILWAFGSLVRPRFGLVALPKANHSVSADAPMASALHIVPFLQLATSQGRRVEDVQA